MPKVVGVKFRTSPRVYWFSPAEGEEYEKDTKVIVETKRGVEFATVVQPAMEVDEKSLVAPLKPIMRIASQSEVEAARQDDEKKLEIIATAKKKAEERGLDLKIVDCEFTVDHSKLVLYFTAANRVDFRELVRDLAQAFKIRIDLRQIGQRDECKLIGTLSPCGLPCCCGRFESDGEHISIKMAKNQGLALTPNKINGMCGRLLCCLGYENKTYEEITKRAPKLGSRVTTPDGRTGVASAINTLAERVKVRFGDDDNFEFAEFDMNELKYDKRVERSEQSDGAEPTVGQNGAEADGAAKPKDNNRKYNKNKPDGKNKHNKTPSDKSKNPDGNQAAEGDRNGGKNERNKNFKRGKKNDNKPETDKRQRPENKYRSERDDKTHGKPEERKEAPHASSVKKPKITMPPDDGE